ncbi:hypothetical protein [Novacetimonas hansenii]|uniref:Uncharacterized protein n=1 Tax=Novacetimonas hansenii TaxID=436 RepID=A0AAW5EUZ6_NOVHA|nr:hypothetical protein [Novacetimonas hansenii]MCJ8354966.1 hypothetical protein [Novacetimonas hansenii]WEQ58528.1 hypothetical protein LV563_11855 [Novacetimonas hansenii]CUW48311.1 hypothetical protein ATCC53582_02448 [Novacetimonas hansenii]
MLRTPPFAKALFCKDFRRNFHDSDHWPALTPPTFQYPLGDKNTPGPTRRLPENRPAIKNKKSVKKISMISACYKSLHFKHPVKVTVSKGQCPLVGVRGQSP